MASLPLRLGSGFRLIGFTLWVGPADRRQGVRTEDEGAKDVTDSPFENCR
jgi:hypothetical protein